MHERKTILIIENNEDARFVLGAVLDHDGYRVVEAADGPEGVSKAVDHLPDLIILDIAMPSMNGFQVGTAIRSHERTRGIPVLAVTADRFDSVQRKHASTLFDSCVSKPIEPSRLMAQVHAMIGSP